MWMNQLKHQETFLRRSDKVPADLGDPGGSRGGATGLARQDGNEQGPCSEMGVAEDGKAFSKSVTPWKSGLATPRADISCWSSITQQHAFLSGFHIWEELSCLTKPTCTASRLDTDDILIQLLI